MKLDINSNQSKLSEKQQEYLIDHDKMFYEGWKAGIDTERKYGKTSEVLKFLNRALPKNDFEFIQATEKRGGLFGYWVAKLDINYIREKLKTVFDLLENK